MRWKIGKEKSVEPVLEEITLSARYEYWHCEKHKVLFGPKESVLRITPEPRYESSIRCPILVTKRVGLFKQETKPCCCPMTYGSWEYWQKYNLDEIKDE